MPRPRDLNEKYEVGKSGRKEMNKDYGSIASLINNEQSSSSPIIEPKTRGKHVIRHYNKGEWELKYTVKVLPPDHHGLGNINLDLGKAKDDPTTYFNDGLRKIDFVLVYEGESPKDTMDFQETLVDNAGGDPERGMKKKQKFSLWRQKYMGMLQAIGLEIEEEVLHRSKNTLHFIRLHGPWPLLCRYAEELNLRAPIQAHPNPSGNWSEWILSTLRLPNIMNDEVPNKPLDYYTCPFKSTKLDKFLGSGDPNTFFSRAQRSRMVYEILATTPFGKEKKGEVGIERMVDEGAYSGAFPLHDVSKLKNSMIEGQKNWSKLVKIGQNSSKLAKI